MFNSVHLFRQFLGAPVSVGTASIPDLTLCKGCTSLPMSHDLPFRSRPVDLLAHFQGKLAEFTMKPLKGLFNKLGPLDSLGRQI